MKNKMLAIGLAAVLSVGALAGCSSPQDASSKTELKNGLPEKYAAGFTVPIINYPPYSIVDETGKVSGFDYDFAQAISDYFGVKFETKNATFEESLLGVSRGSYSWAPAASATTDRKKTYSFVSYFKDGYKLVVQDSAPEIGNTTLDMCGHSIADVTGGYTLKYLQDFSKQCTDAGKSAIEIKTFPDQGAIQLAVKSGRVDAAALTLANGSYTVGKSGGLKVTGPIFAPTVECFTLKKDSDLREPMMKAMNALIENGTYAKILKKYGLEDAAIPKSEIDPEAN
ncbi:glutamine ABC transporter substrate-binding protein [Arthrobacter sp. NicSoilE8]|nr:glutamine ABC transporter substrate-binding protein [Arthrobacter sp. NicSoilE8]